MGSRPRELRPPRQEEHQSCTADLIRFFISTSKLPGSSQQPCEVGGAGKFQSSPFTNEDAEAQRGETACPRLEGTKLAVL